MELRTQVVRYVNSRCGGRIEAAPGWGDIVEAVGGNHFTARNGKVAAPSRSHYPAGSQRHPRTNVGVTDDGRVLMVTIDGRQRGYSVGVTLAEAGRLMLSLGARHSFNLDGGGSTYMGRRRNGQFRVANRPSDGRERLATQALGAFQVIEGP
jgi:exopolysaccharide biosynthesis protein